MKDLSSGFGLVMVYYGNVDQTEHEHGPESAKVRAQNRKTFRAFISRSKTFRIF